ncbi:MAG: hypothetical protein KDK37_15915 [Leptospiraceae bacterium]|nr:hypothetical protein [Leptospiraceae bacterium]MCB1305775.1 hypothetical protein [Leptospiraceae bacterium]
MASISDTLTLLAIVAFLVLAGAGLFVLLSSSQKKLRIRHGALLEPLSGLSRYIELEGIQIGRQSYATGVMDGRKITIKPVPYSTGVHNTGLDLRNGLLIRMKIRYTDRDPMHLVIFQEGQESNFGPDWHRFGPGLLIGPVGGVPLDDQKARVSALTSVTVQALRNLAAEGDGSVSINPDWEINVVGRDAAQRLLQNDGVALTQLELQSSVPGDWSARQLHRYLQHTSRVVEFLEKELPR